eukprot:jgi/Mesvir1/14744/Mv05388-RA.1
MLGEHTASVEVLRGKRVHWVQFIVPEFVRRLAGDAGWTGAVLADLHDVERDNPVLKAQQLLEKMRICAFRVMHLEEVEDLAWGMIPSRLQRQMRTLVFRIPFVNAVCVLILLALRYGESENDWRSHKPWRYAVLALSIVQLALCLASVFVFWRFEGSVVVFLKRWAAMKKEEDDAEGDEDADGDDHKEEGDGEEEDEDEEVEGSKHPGKDTAAKPPKRRQRVARDPLDEEVYKAISMPLPAAKSDAAREHGWGDRLTVMCAPTFIYTIVLLAVSLLSLFVSPLFHVIFLIDFLLYQPSGRLVLQSLVVGGPGLLKTGIVVIITIAFYTVGTFVFFRDRAGPCTTLYECLGMHMLFGLTSDIAEVVGGVGEDWRVVPEDFASEPKDQLRTLYSLGYFIIWVFLLQNIITGQIVDAFVSIRDEKARLQQDLNDKCFICSLERIPFEQRPGGFMKHVEKEHNVLSYLYYIIYLESVQQSETTGMGAYVLEQVREGRVDWIPIGRSLQLDTRKRDEEQEGAVKHAHKDDLANIAGALHELSGKVGTAMAAMQARMSALERRMYTIQAVISGQMPANGGQAGPPVPPMATFGGAGGDFVG